MFIKFKFRIYIEGLCTFLSILLTSSNVLAEPIWHCSRSDVQLANAADNFSLAALDTEREVIRISLRDLYGIYQGQTIKASGMVVSACFVGADNPLTKVAMKSIGAEPNVLQKLAHQSNLVGTNVYMVPNEEEMLACMTKHHPAIGYMPKATHNEAIGPCF
jgi:hypothetical protein